MSELHCDPGFRQLLAQHFSIALLEQHPGTVYGLWPDFTLAYMNPAWFRFARDNQGEPVISTDWIRGRRITDALPEVLHPFYVELYLRGLENSSDQPLLHDYECSSAQEYRCFNMSLHNLGFGAGLLVINRDQQVGRHWRTPHPAQSEQYRDSAGQYCQCTHCRCYKNRQQKRSNHWDWIPDWISHPPYPIDYGLCPNCFAYYYNPDNC